MHNNNLEARQRKVYTENKEEEGGSERVELCGTDRATLARTHISNSQSVIGGACAVDATEGDFIEYYIIY